MWLILWSVKSFIENVNGASSRKKVVRQKRWATWRNFHFSIHKSCFSHSRHPFSLSWPFFFSIFIDIINKLLVIFFYVSGEKFVFYCLRKFVIPKSTKTAPCALCAEIILRCRVSSLLINSSSAPKFRTDALNEIKSRKFLLSSIGNFWRGERTHFSRQRGWVSSDRLRRKYQVISLMRPKLKKFACIRRMEWGDLFHFGNSIFLGQELRIWWNYFEGLITRNCGIVNEKLKS